MKRRTSAELHDAGPSAIQGLTVHTTCIAFLPTPMPGEGTHAIALAPLPIRLYNTRRILYRHSLMKRAKKGKLLYKLLVFVLPLLFLSIVITSIILSWTGYTYFLKTVNQDYSNIIKSSAGEIHLYMDNAQKNLEGLAGVISATKLDSWQKEMALTAFNHTAPEFISISLMSLDGKTIVSTGWEGQASMLSHADVFRRAVEGETAASGLMRTRDNIPFAHMGVPVRRLGTVREILWGELNLKLIWDVLEGINVGQTGQVFIIDLSGQFVGHREIDRVVRALPSIRPEILQELRESGRPVQWIDQKNGAKSYCMGYRIASLDWIIVLGQDYPEIYGYLYQNIYWAILVTCLICVAAVLLGWRSVKRFLTPIQSLHGQVQNIGSGNFDQKITVDSPDEIGDLGLAFNDMTDSLKGFIQREVETAKQLVQAKNLALLNTTSSKVTHEVGNLLNNVGLTLRTLRGEDLSEKGERALEIIEKDADRVRKFTQNFLQFAKEPELNPERTSLEGIIREILVTQGPMAENRGVHLEMDWPVGLPSINVDTRLINQVLNNLVKNSLEAMTDPGDIRIAGAKSEERLLVRIEDTGPGIKPDALERVFDPFFTTKGKKGTGLGLSIVKTIVEAHRGSIECESSLGTGTTFILSFPLK